MSECLLRNTDSEGEGGELSSALESVDTGGGGLRKSLSDQCE